MRLVNLAPSMIAGPYDDCPFDADNDADGDGICGNEDRCPADVVNDTGRGGVCDDIDDDMSAWKLRVIQSGLSIISAPHVRCTFAARLLHVPHQSVREGVDDKSAWLFTP